MRELNINSLNIVPFWKTFVTRKMSTIFESGLYSNSNSKQVSHSKQETISVIFTHPRGGGGGVLPYKGLMGTCGQPGYVFRDFCLKQGIEFIICCLNQGIDLSIVVLNRINFLNRVSKIGILS